MKVSVLILFHFGQKYGSPSTGTSKTTQKKSNSHIKSAPPYVLSVPTSARRLYALYTPYTRLIYVAYIGGYTGLYALYTPYTRLIYVLNTLIRLSKRP